MEWNGKIEQIRFTVFMIRAYHATDYRRVTTLAGSKATIQKEIYLLAY